MNFIATRLHGFIVDYIVNVFEEDDRANLHHESLVLRACCSLTFESAVNIILINSRNCE